MSSRLKYLVPLMVFGIMAVFLYVGLWLNPHEVPSPLINKPAPAFELSQLHNAVESFSTADMKGKVWLLNVWASWCRSCRAEHPLLVELSRSREVPIYGLNYKDERADAIGWLKKFGNPYDISVHDYDGRVGMDYGVYGVPETYLIDQQGVIRYKQIGPVTREAIKEKILPMVRELRG
ncbi:MAG: DsbE family thiol:disulfide interchange protein [Gammaproteobacteria bacterium]